MPLSNVKRSDKNVKFEFDVIQGFSAEFTDEKSLFRLNSLIIITALAQNRNSSFRLCNVVSFYPPSLPFGLDRRKFSSPKDFLQWKHVHVYSYPKLHGQSRFFRTHRLIRKQDDCIDITGVGKTIFVWWISRSLSIEVEIVGKIFPRILSLGSKYFISLFDCSTKKCCLQRKRSIFLMISFLIGSSNHFFQMKLMARLKTIFRNKWKNLT